MKKSDIKLLFWMLLLFGLLVIAEQLFLMIVNIKEISIQNNTHKQITESVESRLSQDAQDAQRQEYFSLVLPEEKAILINLSKMKLYLIQNKKIIQEFDVATKGPADKWFRTPAGYYKIGAKYPLLRSSKVDVYMPYSLQFYEDFFIHGIPYFPNGVKVTSSFSGGCLRLQDNDAKIVYDFADKGTMVVVIDEIPSLDSSSNFIYPVDIHKSWIRQSFISPQKIGIDYLQHTGVDFATIDLESVMAVFDGVVVYIQNIGPNDHGFGNTIILEHNINQNKIYTLYGHLENIQEGLKEGDFVKKGDIIGMVGASGYGCSNYWRIGQDGCFEPNVIDRHLHFEVKTKPVLTNPDGESLCHYNGNKGLCFGYTPKYPQDYGYINPIDFLNQK